MKKQVEVVEEGGEHRLLIVYRGTHTHGVLSPRHTKKQADAFGGGTVGAVVKEELDYRVGVP